MWGRWDEEYEILQHIGIKIYYLNIISTYFNLFLCFSVCLQCIAKGTHLPGTGTVKWASVNGLKALKASKVVIDFDCTV